MKAVASGNWPVKIEQPLPLQLPLLPTPSHRAHLAGQIHADVYITGLETHVCASGAHTNPAHMSL